MDFELREVRCMVLPRFVAEGYAVLKNGDFYADDDNDGIKYTLGEKLGFENYISLKPNAPLWAQDEYKEYLEILSVQCSRNDDNEFTESNLF